MISWLLTWAKDYRPYAALAALFCFLWLTQKPQVETKIEQVDKIHTATRVEIRYRDVPGAPGQDYRPLPCPDVTVEATDNIEHWQSVKPTPSPPKNGLWIGGGFFEAPYAQVELSIDRLKLDAKVGPASYGGGLSYRLFSF